jgi:hypothetical protein
MPLNHIEQLPDLVGFDLASYLLKVQKLWNVRVHEDVVTSLDSGHLKTKRFRQSEKDSESHIMGGQKNAFEKPARSHAATGYCPSSRKVKP